MAPITKKTTSGPTLKLGGGLKSSVGKSSAFGGKGSNIYGSSGKSGKTLSYSDRTGSFFGSSSKSSEKRSSHLEPKSSNFTKTSSVSKEKDTNVLLGSAVKSSNKTTNVLGSSEKSSNFSPPNEKITNPFSGKTSNHDLGHNYPSFINAKSNKPSASFGIIWLPTRKHKKKDTVYDSHNYDHYKDRSPKTYNYMSGDSPDYQLHKKKEEETLLVPERPKVTSVAVNTGITAANVDIKSDSSEQANSEEKQEFIRRDPEESKEAAGDNNDNIDKNSKDYLENNDNLPKKPDNKWDGEKQGDKVDSVYLRPQPPHKARSTPSTNEEEDCGIKCLYYTLQCCDCVLQ